MMKTVQGHKEVLNGMTEDQSYGLLTSFDVERFHGYHARMNEK